MFAPQLHGIALLHRRFQKYDQVLHSIFLWCQHNKFKLNLGRSWRKHLRFSEAILQKDLVFRFRPWINSVIRYSWYQAHFANWRPSAALHTSYSRAKQNHKQQIVHLDLGFLRRYWWLPGSFDLDLLHSRWILFWQVFACCYCWKSLQTKE